MRSVLSPSDATSQSTCHRTSCCVSDRQQRLQILSRPLQGNASFTTKIVNLYFLRRQRRWIQLNQAADPGCSSPLSIFARPCMPSWRSTEAVWRRTRARPIRSPSPGKPRSHCGPISLQKRNSILHLTQCFVFSSNKVPATSR